jgi:hypothetical protein
MTATEARARLADGLRMRAESAAPDPILTPMVDKAAEILDRPAAKKRGSKLKQFLVPGAIIGLDDCREALAVLFEAKGRDVCRGVLKQFDAARVGDLAPAAHVDFIRACQKA